jgi:hypothetical protein
VTVEQDQSLCHPIYLTIKSGRWGDPLEEFLFPVIELLGDLSRRKRIWLATCPQIAELYEEAPAGWRAEE